MRLEYDPSVDAAYVRFRAAAVMSTEEVAPGVMLDLGDDGRPVGLELLDASAVFGGPPSGVQFEVLVRAKAAGS
jgi:uncharacterized protein YuzE